MQISCDVSFPKKIQHCRISCLQNELFIHIKWRFFIHEFLKVLITSEFNTQFIIIHHFFASICMKCLLKRFKLKSNINEQNYLVNPSLDRGCHEYILLLKTYRFKNKRIKRLINSKLTTSLTPVNLFKLQNKKIQC